MKVERKEDGEKMKAEKIMNIEKEEIMKVEETREWEMRPNENKREGMRQNETRTEGKIREEKIMS